MIVRYPSYYDKFQCIAGACEDTCCAGWEIDIDDETYEAYMQVEGEFGERLRRMIKEYHFEEDECYESHGFCLKENRRCAFLDDNNLCEIYRELGEDALSYVCTHTPRNYLEYGGAREIAISVSCPEAGRLIFGSQEKMCQMEKEIHGEPDYKETEEELIQAATIRRMRDEAIALLQNRHKSMDRRMDEMLQYAEAAQGVLNREAWDEKVRWQNTEQPTPEQGEIYHHFLGRMKSYTQLASINERWEQQLIALQERYHEATDGQEAYGNERGAFGKFMKQEKREIWLEQLAVYYAFMCLPRSVDGLDFLGQAKFVATSYLMIEDMAMCLYAKIKDKFNLESFSAVARIYAKEVEHSEENLDFLAEEILFEEIFEVGKLRECFVALP